MQDFSNQSAWSGSLFADVRRLFICDILVAPRNAAFCYWLATSAQSHE